jgi:tetratricopeptide (TPR) repeat protein
MFLKGSSGSRRTYVSWVILGFLVLLIVVGLVSGGGYLYLRFSSPSRWSDPVQQLRKDRIDPSLALLALAGVDDLEVVNRALVAEELETAYPTILFSTELADGERVGSLLLLAQTYSTAGDNSRAQLCYQQANLITTLSPTLSDFAKANAFLEIGRGLAGLGSKGEALSNYDQAHVVASHSPYMRDPHRADVLGKLAEGYQALGENAKGSECSAQQVDIRYVFGEAGEASESPPEQPISPLMMEIPEPTEAMIASYEQRRVETVQQLIDSSEGASEGEAIPEDLMTDVAQALLNEDEARQGIYEQQLAGASSMVLKIGIAQARVHWLIIKYRVALGGYGLEPVPGWTEDLADIEAELNAAYGELHNTYEEQIGTFSDDTAVDRAWFHLLRFEIEQGRFGLYPDYPQEELLSQLTGVTERLIASGDLSLYVDVVYEGDTPLFTLATAE